MSVLLAILLTPEPRIWRNAGVLATAMWQDSGVGGYWRIGRNRGSFHELLKGNNNPPEDAWTSILSWMSGRACEVLDLAEADVSGLLQAIARPATSLQNCLDAAFDFATAISEVLVPIIDTTMSESPFWDSGIHLGIAPEAEVKSQKILDILSGNYRRIVCVSGPPFSAKREILKSVVGYLIRTSRGFLEVGERRLPIFAQALGAWSTDAFIDRLFRFYSGGTVDQQGLLNSLEQGAKLAFIRAAAKARPAFVVLSDVEPFDEDALVRRLRGDQVGDILDAIIRGHRDTRILLGVTSTLTAGPDAGAIEIMPVGPSRDEFNLALKFAPISLDLGERDAPLSALTMRVAIAVLRKLRVDPALLGDRVNAFQGAVREDNAGVVFRLFWDRVCSAEDQILFGLVASSHDGLRLDTLVKIMRALKRMEHAKEKRCALDELVVDAQALRDWQNLQQDLIRWRQNDDGDSDPLNGTLYIRDPIRSLVLEVWASSPISLWHDGMWCIAREAARQAKEQGLRYGLAGSSVALTRHIQALHGLLSSIDPADVGPSDHITAPPAGVLETEILPPLEVDIPRRPDATRCYRYAWSQLYLADIDYEHELINAQGDATGRLDALLPFLKPDRPWANFAERALAEDGRPLTLTSLGPAQKGLRASEQLDLLTRISMAALITQDNRLVIDCIDLAKLVIEQPGISIEPLDRLRLLRVEIDLHLLLGGDPRARNPDLRPSNFELHDLNDDAYRLGPIDRLIATAIETLVDPGRPRESDDFILGKLNLRRAELHHVCGDPAREQRALRTALQCERRLLKRDGAGALAPITAGYGVRRLIRYVLERNQRRRFEAIVFPDGLRWPVPRRASRTTLRVVRGLLEVNERRTIRGIRADRVGILIDRCRIAIASGDLADALSQLDAATKAGPRTANADDSVLELSALRIEVLIAQAMAEATKPASMPGDGLEVLVETCRAALRAHEELAGKALVVYAARGVFFEGQLALLESRLSLPGTSAYRMKLALAHDRLTEALALFDRIGIGLWAPRAQALLEACKAIMASPHDTLTSPA